MKCFSVSIECNTITELQMALQTALDVVKAQPYRYAEMEIDEQEQVTDIPRILIYRSE